MEIITKCKYDQNWELQKNLTNINEATNKNVSHKIQNFVNRNNKFIRKKDLANFCKIYIFYIVQKCIFTDMYIVSYKLSMLGVGSKINGKSGLTSKVSYR